MQTFDSRFAPAETANGLSFELSHLAVRQTDTLTFSCLFAFRRTSFEPVLSALVDETISFRTEVSFIAKIELLWN